MTGSGASVSSAPWPRSGGCARASPDPDTKRVQRIVLSTIWPKPVAEPEELLLDAAFLTLARERVDLGFVLQDGMFLSERRQIAALAAAARLPIMCGFREHIEDGGLMSYGIDLREKSGRLDVNRAR